MFTQFIRLEYITIFVLMKRIIIKIQNNVKFVNGLSYYLIAIGRHACHHMCVYFKKYVS